MIKTKKSSSRRKFLTTSTALLLGSASGLANPIHTFNILKNYGRHSSKIAGVTVGVITYSFRSLEDQSLEATLQYILDLE